MCTPVNSTGAKHEAAAAVGQIAWWRHKMETFSALLALCAGNSPVPVNSPHNGHWRGTLMFSLICAWINDWVNNREAGDLRRHRGHYDVNVMVTCHIYCWRNKANLRDLIAATSLVILYEIGFKWSIFLSMRPWIWWITTKTIGHLFCTTSSFVHLFKPIGELKLELQSRNAQFGSKLAIFCPVWLWNLMDDIEKQ